MSQRLCEWRGKFARGALSVLEKHFDSENFKAENDKRSPEKVAEYARHMLEETEVGYRFVYADTENQVCALPTAGLVLMQFYFPPEIMFPPSFYSRDSRYPLAKH